MASTPESESEIAVAALLREAAAAHGAYETNELGGAFDEDWPTWYATYLLGHGLGQYLSGKGPHDVNTVAATLKALAMDYEREHPTRPWPDVYAARLVAG